MFAITRVRARARARRARIGVADPKKILARRDSPLVSSSRCTALESACVPSPKR